MDDAENTLDEGKPMIDPQCVVFNLTIDSPVGAKGGLRSEPNGKVNNQAHKTES